LIPCFPVNEGTVVCPFFQIEVKIKKRAAFAFCYGPTRQFG
jgi:hypothetical protein